MLTEFWAMWESHGGWISAARHRTELVEDATKPVHSAIYRVGSKTREFEKVEIDKIPAETAIKLAQSESEALLVFTPKKIALCASALIMEESRR